MSGEEPSTVLLRELPDVGIDEVAIRRLRKRIIQDAAALPTFIPRRTIRGSVLAFSGLVTVVVAVIAYGSSGPRITAPPDVAASVLAYDATDARWSRRIDVNTEWVDLFEGHFQLEIRKQATAKRVIVTVPDGRIDDLGTIFDVVVSGGVTTHVRVADGHVVAHLRGLPDVTLDAGQRWDRPFDEGRERGPGPVGRSLGTPAHTDPANSERAKMHRSLNRSKAHIAASRSKVQGAEDAAYLNVIRLLRASRRADANAAARDYLLRFPDGFRHEEMRALGE